MKQEIIVYSGGDTKMVIEYDECGLPVHLKIRVNKEGEGPINDSDPDYDHDECWCGIKGCKKYESQES